jgi:hypothetical protein
MASIGRVRVGNPEEYVAATAVVLRFGVRLEHGRRKTTDRWPPPVSETMKGEARLPRLWAGLGCWTGTPRRAAALLIGPRGAAQAPARESRPSGHRAVREER